MKKMKLGVLVAVFFAMQFSAGVLQAADDQQEKIAAKRAELNDHEWQIKIISAADKSKVTEDTLVFKDQMFEAKGMISKGYKPTNYTVSLQEGGPTVWETMQSIESGSPIFWRGEWEGERMNGVMSKQVGEGKNEDYYFSSVSSKAIEKAPEPEPVKEEVAPAAVEAKDAAADVKKAAEEAPAAAVKEAEKAAAPKVEKAAETAKEVTKEAPKKKKKWGF